MTETISAGAMFGLRRRRWPNIKPAQGLHQELFNVMLAQCLLDCVS